MKVLLDNQKLGYALIFSILLLLGLFGCSDNSSDPNTSGSQGEIKMYLVDSPGNYDAVNLVVTEVSVHLSTSDTVSGWIVINDSIRTVNLLSLTNGTYAMLGTHRLDVGRYSQIRLKLRTGSNVIVDGVTYPLNIPSGTQTGVKLHHQFDITTNALYELTLDFDVAHSIHVTGNNQFQMSPVIRVVSNLVSGSISGVVSPATATAIITTTIGIDSVTTYTNATTGAFRLMVLPAGTYTVLIQSNNINYFDSTITGVPVAALQNRDIGTIALRHR